MKIGVQLYTLRDFCKTSEDFAETLKKVADIGYTSVQVSGTCAYEGEWLSEQLKKNGLTCDLTHYSPDEMLADPVAVVNKHKKFDCKYIGIGAMPGIGDNNTKENWEKFIASYQPVAKQFKDMGCYLMYHNHHYEFFDINGERCWDYLTKSFAPDEMGFTLDVHWVLAGGHDPLVELKALKGRIPCVHFKDYTATLSGERRFAPVGEGIIDFNKIANTCVDLGVEYAFVEQDDCYGEDPFACVKRSYDYLTSLGLK